MYQKIEEIISCNVEQLLKYVYKVIKIKHCINSRIAVKKPILFVAHMARRLAFAQ